MSYSNISQEPQIVEEYENNNSKIFDHVFTSFNPTGNCIPDPTINMQKNFLYTDTKNLKNNILADEVLRKRTNNKHVYTHNEQQKFADIVNKYDLVLQDCYEDKINCLNKRKQNKIKQLEDKKKTINNVKSNPQELETLKDEINRINTEINIMSDGLYTKNSLLDDPKQREISTFENVFYSLPTDPLKNESCSDLRLGNSSRDIARDVYKKVHCKKQIVPKDRNMFGEKNDGGAYENESKYKDWLCKQK